MEKKEIGLQVHSLLQVLVLCLFVIVGCDRTRVSESQRVSKHDSTEAGNSSYQQTSDIEFTDVTDQSGVAAVYDNGEAAGQRSIVESLGGGVAAFDYDADGRCDLAFTGGGTLVPYQPLQGKPHALFRKGNEFHYLNVSEPAKFWNPLTYTHGLACADFNNDGFTDALVTGYGGLQLLLNQGDGTFADVTQETGVADNLWSSSAAWLDIEGDGDLDLYVAHYVNWSWENHPACPASVADKVDICSPNDFAPLPDVIFCNQGNGNFTKEDVRYGLASDGKGLGVVAAHLNEDNFIDIYVANDTRNNFLYLNNDRAKLSEVGLISGTAVDVDGTPNGSMGLAVFDFDNDLASDIWVTNYENETCALYKNDGQGNFLWATDRAGINSLGTLFVSFGTVTGDFEADGDQDVVVANGHIMLYPRNSRLAQENLLLANTLRSVNKSSNHGRLERNTAAGSFFAERHRGRGLAKADLDGDGDLDLVFSNVNENARILRNDSVAHGRNVILKFVGRSSNRDAIGLRAVVQTNSNRYLRQVVGGGSYLSQSCYEVHWGIPEGEHIQKIELIWPSGLRQTVRLPAAADVPYTFIEPL